jgi:cytoskeletal protein CcmA (bactofilin family)
MVRVRRRALIVFGAFLLLALTTSVVAGTDMLGGKLRTGDQVTVPSSETVDHDLYIAAGTVTVDGTVKGDLVAVGGTIQVNGEVDGDLLVAAGNVIVNGPVSGDVRLAAGQMSVDGSVGEDVAVVGGNLTVAGKVGQDLIFSTGSASVQGNVTGNIAGSTGGYSRSGTVGGSEDVTQGQGRAAPTPNPTAANQVLDAIRQLVVVLLFGLLALWLIPATFRSAEATVRTRPLPSLGIGVVTCLGYIAAILALIVGMIVLTIVLALLTLGALVAIEILAAILAIFLLTLSFIVAVAFVADAVVGLALGRWFMPALGMRMGTDRWSDLGILAAGAAVVVIVTSIPVIGGLVKLAVVLVGLGALTIVAWATWRAGRRAPGMQPPPAAPVAPEPPSAADGSIPGAPAS